MLYYRSPFFFFDLHFWPKNGGTVFRIFPNISEYFRTRFWAPKPDLWKTLHCAGQFGRANFLRGYKFALWSCSFYLDWSIWPSSPHWHPFPLFQTLGNNCNNGPSHLFDQEIFWMHWERDSGRRSGKCCFTRQVFTSDLASNTQKSSIGILRTKGPYYSKR